MNDSNYNIVPANEDNAERKALTKASSRALSNVTTRVDVDGDTLDLKQIWRYILRHKKLIIVITVLTTLITYAANKMLLPTYNSSALIQINQNNSIIRYSQVDSGMGSRGRGYNYIPTQISVLKSSRVAERVITLLNLENNPEITGELRQRGIVDGLREIKQYFSHDQLPDPVDAQSSDMKRVNNLRKHIAMVSRFLSKLDIVAEDKTQLIRIKFKSFSPELTASVVNALIKAYQQVDEENASLIKSQAQKALQKKLQEVQDKLKVSEKRLTAFSRRTGISDLEDSGSLANKKIIRLNEEFLNAQSQVIKDSALLDLYQGSSKEIMLPNVLNDQILNQLKSERLALKTKYRQLLQIYQPSYPQLQQLQADIQEIEKYIAEKEREHETALETNLHAAQDMEKLLSEKLQQQNDDLLDLKDSSVEYNLLKREWESNKQLYAGLLERVKLSGVTSDLETAKVSIIEKAVVPLGPFAPNVRKNTLTAGLTGFLLSLGLAGVLGLIDRRVRSPEDLSEIVAYPNLALIPIISTPKRSQKNALPEVPELFVTHNPNAMFSETFRALRTGLTYSLPGGLPHTLMVTSSLPSEAKTTTITNLALVLQKTEKKSVLIVDLDLRKPRMHKIFNLPSAPGVTDCLVNSELEVPVYKLEELGISVLTAGTLSQNTSEMLESDQFNKLFNKIKLDYDIILIDAPPVMGLADSLIISTKVDALVLAVSAEVSTIDSIKSSINKLESIGARIVGTVMTKFDIASESYNSGYYYHSYNYQYGQNHDRGNDKPMVT